MRHLIPCLIPALLPAQVPVPPRGPDTVAAAERAFAAEAARTGTPAAFLTFLTEDATLFTPKPMNGWEAQRAQKDDGSRLAWEPEQVELAASGDLALSTGPWTWRPAGAPDPAAAGHFLSLWIWRDGRWRVLLDVGTPHAAQAPRPLSLRTLAAPVDPGAPAAREGAWKAFDAAASKDLHQALRSWGAPDLRLYRRGRWPEPGRGPEGAGSSVSWEPLGIRAAASEDLAFRWGLRRSGGVTASAVQVWRREPAGWRLAMDADLPWAKP